MYNTHLVHGAGQSDQRGQQANHVKAIGVEFAHQFVRRVIIERSPAAKRLDRRVGHVTVLQKRVKLFKNSRLLTIPSESLTVKSY